MHLRALAEEQLTLARTATNDSILAVTSSKRDNLKGNFKYIKTKDMVEGYYVHKKADANPLVNRTGVEARINDIGEIYLITLLNGRSINHEQISISSSNGEYKSIVVPYNGSTNYRFKDAGVSNEMVTFRGPECDTLAYFINDNINANLKLNFIGKSKYSMPLSKTDKEILNETQQYSQAVKESKKAADQKLYLEQRLRINREQIEKIKQKN